MPTQKDEYVMSGDRVESDSPDRCQSLYKEGQCPFRKVEGSDYCAMHGGNSVLEAAKRASLRNYKLTKFQARLDRFATNPKVKDLRDEIAILRMTLEERLNSLNGPNDLIIHSHVISDLVLKINTVVSSCHKLENSMGQLLDKQAILQFGSEIIRIISEEITEDPELLNRIADKIMNVYGTLGDEEI